MDHADEVLGDEQILTVVYEALGMRHQLSRTRGRKGTPAEVVLRLRVGREDDVGYSAAVSPSASRCFKSANSSTRSNASKSCDHFEDQEEPELTVLPKPIR
jgi:hypothetical protein